jgi:cobalt/nickel transport system permease protein
MRASLQGLWGCGRGPVKRAAPPSRLVAGLAVFAACMVSTGATLGGSVCAGATAGAWVVLCRPPWRVLRPFLLLGPTLFLPYFLLSFVPGAGPAANGSSAFVTSWTIALRGLSGMLVGAATVTSLSPIDLREALTRLPVPRVVSAILLQIVQGTALLFDETTRMADAMAVRGASSGGAGAWRVLFALPQAWLPRVVSRAERLGAAMELRGYGEGSLHALETTPLGLADAGVLAVAVAALGIAVAVRVVGGR